MLDRTVLKDCHLENPPVHSLPIAPRTAWWRGGRKEASGHERDRAPSLSERLKVDGTTVQIRGGCEWLNHGRSSAIDIHPPSAARTAALSEHRAADMAHFSGSVGIGLGRSGSCDSDRFGGGL